MILSQLNLVRILCTNENHWARLSAEWQKTRRKLTVLHFLCTSWAALSNGGDKICGGTGNSDRDWLAVELIGSVEAGY